MTRFLAIIRRIFGWGTVSLILGLFLFGIKFSFASSEKMFFTLFFILSPILFIVFTIISVAYIRKYGQFAEVHQEQASATSFFRCLGHDLWAPFKNIGGLFAGIFNKNAQGRGLLILRFFEMVAIQFICLVGISVLM